MYLSQTIKVNLTNENTELLKRPSKVFNKIKSLFSGDMTPTEHQQAEVMLSVLQRLNVAFRRSGLTRLVSIIADDQVLYEDSPDSSENLHEGNNALADELYNGKLNRIDTLRLTVDGEEQDLRYLIHVCIKRKPKGDETPVMIDIYGFINEFKQQATETEIDLALRVKSLIEQKWPEKADRKQYMDALEAQFEKHVASLQQAVNEQFPARSNLEPSRKVLREKAMHSHYANHNARYNDSCAYFPIFFTFYHEDGHADEMEELDLSIDNQGDWDFNGSSTASDNQSSWADGASFADSSDGGSRCGGGCGGGCGGS